MEPHHSKKAGYSGIEVREGGPNLLLAVIARVFDSNVPFRARPRRTAKAQSIH